MTKKFFKQVVQVVVLSEDSPAEWDNLKDLDYLITIGNCSGMISTTEEVEVDAKTMASLLIEQATDPEFFGLDEHGNFVDGDNDEV